MIRERRDEYSGAIIFEPDEESLVIADVVKRLDTLEKENKELKKKLTKLEKK